MRTFASFFILLAIAAYAQNFAIKGPAAPKPYEANAMKELGDYLAKRIDGPLTVGRKSPVVFHVGDTEFAKANGFASSQFQDEQWIIKSIDNNVILNGGGTHGALYAVYHFLEDCCDIHWWNEFEEHVPKASPLSLPALDAKGRPAFLYRDIYRYGHNHPHGEYAVLAIRNRLNRAGDIKVRPEFGGSFNYGPPDHCHTFERYIPEDVYFKEHPEYFAMRNGKRVPGARSQLCLTNPDVRRIFAEKLLAYIKQGDEEAAKSSVAPPRIYDISMNDVANESCECPNCKDEIAEYGHSGYLLRFVNMLAEEVAKARPEIFISTLAYFEHDKPPKGGVRANDNVIVKLCDTFSNQAASILEDDNKKYRELVTEWSRHAKHLFVWDYAITFVHGNSGLPFASEFHYGDLFRHYLENNVTGVFWEHERADRTDMYELKFFLETKLMEAPYQDVDSLIDFFMTRYYGAAAPHMLKYRREIDKARRDNHGYITYFSGYSTYSYITNKMIPHLQAVFDDAEAAVKDDATLFLRVRRARMGLDNLTARRIPFIPHGYDIKDNIVTLPTREAAERYAKTYNAWVVKFAEATNLKAQMREWIQTLGKTPKPVPVPKELEGRRFFDCIPVHFANETPARQQIVSDPESPVGEAMRITVATSRNYNMPFALGVYDQEHEKTLSQVMFRKIPDGAGYHWFKIPAVTMPDDGYAFVSRAWTIQVPFTRDYISGRKFEVWVSAKHVGEQFHAGQGKPEYIFVDRLVFVEAE